MRRTPNNVVDVVAPGGRYLRALRGGPHAAIVEVTQSRPDAIDVRICGGGKGDLAVVAAMLGADVDLGAWYRRVRGFAWLADLVRSLRGLKPPRYPSLWEALCHAIVFQQLSLVAAAAIMKRFVQRFSSPLMHGGVELYPFPEPRAIEGAREATLRSLGLSRMKARYLQGAARDVIRGAIDARAIEPLHSDEASLALRRVHGIGRWSAAVVLLRGLGRLDVFPPADSGVARSLELLAGRPAGDTEVLLDALGPVRGMLYFHLLLGTRFSAIVVQADPGV